MKNKQVAQAIKDILWMARRYADGRQTYAVQMFNDAYDTLRTEFGERIDDLSSPDKNKMDNYPYATDGGGEMFNTDLNRRPYSQSKAEQISSDNQEKENKFICCIKCGQPVIDRGMTVSVNMGEAYSVATCENRKCERYGLLSVIDLENEK